MPFERAWLEPFFKSGPARQAVEKYRADDWSAAEAGFSRALRGLPRRGDERQPVTIGGDEAHRVVAQDELRAV